jgi:GT2 family glycosyltransferase
MLIDIVIVNWNAGSQLADCISSIESHGDGFVSRAIVIDNGSGDGSPDTIESVPIVDLVRTGKNLGFGKACNVGARRGTAEFILFLNPDTRLHHKTLSDTISFMCDPSAQRVGICGVQLLDEAGHVSRSSSRAPTVGRLVARASGIDLAFPRLGSRMAEWDHAEPRQVDQVIGAYFFVRRSVFEALGGFDERFFVYFEEVDFARRAAVAGWTSWYLTSSQAFHAGGGTSHQIKARRLFYSLRSRLQYAAKHFSTGGTLVVGAATLLIEPLARCGQALVRGRTREAGEVLTAYRWLLGWLVGGRIG